MRTAKSGRMEQHCEMISSRRDVAAAHVNSHQRGYLHKTGPTDMNGEGFIEPPSYLKSSE